MLVEHVFHLARVDVVAAGDDHVLLAVHDPEEAILIHAGDVARVQPALPQNFGRLIGTLPVPLHHLRALECDLTCLARGQAFACLQVHDLGVGVGDGDANGAHLASAEEGIGMGDWRALSQSIALYQLATRQALELFLHFGW